MGVKVLRPYRRPPRVHHVLLIEDIERVRRRSEYGDAEYSNEGRDGDLSRVQWRWVDLHGR